jgi:hypothetical protein
MPRYTVTEEIDLLVEAGLLTERQSEAWVRRRVEAEPGWSVAEDMDIAESTLSDYVSDAEAKIGAARATTEAVDAIRDQLPAGDD